MCAEWVGGSECQCSGGARDLQRTCGGSGRGGFVATQWWLDCCRGVACMNLVSIAASDVQTVEVLRATNVRSLGAMVKGRSLGRGR